ncbi:MAG: apolipoprotein N-acyltransferase [Bdellovibrionota bacterium]
MMLRARVLAGITFSALVTSFSFPPYQFGLLMLVGLVPLFVALESAQTLRQAAFRGWFYGFVSNVLVCNWLGSAIETFSSLPWLASQLGIVLVSILEQSSWAVFAAARFYVNKRLGMRPLFWSAAAIMALDSIWPKLFPNTMGNAFYNVSWLAQAADLTGVWGLTAVIVISNEALALGWLWFAKGNRFGLKRIEILKHASVAVLVLVAVSSYGIYRKKQIQAVLLRKPDKSFPVAIVQPNINAVAQIRGQTNKELARSKVLTEMIRLTNAALVFNPKLVVWPETAYPDTFHGESLTESILVTQTLDRYLRENQVSLLFGARDQVGHRRFNAFILASPDRGGSQLIRQVYHKTHLLEFAEHVPFADSSPALAETARSLGASTFSYGEGPKNLSLDGIKLGVMICLEGLFPDFVRRTVAGGAEILFNATNDAWFGDTREPSLHLYLTAFRSIETRRPLVRATNTGYSTVIGIDGQLRMKSKLFTEDVIFDDVPLYSGIKSPFVFWGNTLLHLSALWMLWPWATTWLRRRKAC